jgi:hypothetical protein
MSSPDWDATLDAFARRLDEQWSALDRNALDEITPFVAPAVDAPLPAELAQRAVELVQRCRALEDSLAAALARVSHDLDRAAAPAAAPAQPVYFDSRI